ncbi:MAG: glutamate-1-semialdehyde 2,1-aminomutase [Candidatus Marinimicrobia bacterium]|nr:glutamate-1-semialdehyde 2,1-aminomutase [Candidatus Neomarinimicrobiota bacterium]
MIRAKSQRLFEEARALIPGGVNSPVRAFKSVGGEPVFMASAAGATLTDVDGNVYVDFVGSWGPMIVGHAHPRVVEAIEQALSKGTSFGTPSEAESRLARMVIDRVPSIDLVRMVNSGTEATMSAVRLARGYTGRSKIIKFEGCYHGHGDSFLIKAGSGALTLGVPDSQGVPEAIANQTLVATFNDLHSIEAQFALFPEDIAAVIIEPIAGNMGCIPGEKAFLEGLQAICERMGALLIFDEVMTGFRVHPAGAQGLYGLEPDLSTFGKIIGGGLPVGAYGGRREIMEMIAPLGPVYQAGTLSGNPLAMAAGIATLELCDESLYTHLETLGADFETELKALNLPITINRAGSMFTLFMTARPVAGYADVAACDMAQFSSFFNFALDIGIYLPPSQYEAAFISGAHGAPELEKLLETVKAFFAG